jgi:protein gp37
MAGATKIEWSDATWNVVTGCEKVSPGCDHCYAETFAERWRGTPGHHFENGFDLTLRPERLDLPLRWKKPRRIFVNSMSDLFHQDVPEEFIAKVWTVMAATPQHTYQILTKRHARMRSVVRRIAWRTPTTEERRRGVHGSQAYVQANEDLNWHLGHPEVLRNVWLGVSAEDQQRAALRIPALLDTPAAVRFVSAEPLLGPIDLRNLRSGSAVIDSLGGDVKDREGVVYTGTPSVLDWVIVGGESGPGARPMHPDWVRTLRDQCTAADVAFFFKQWGEYITATVEDDPAFAGGRAYQLPGHGRTAACIRERGPSGTFRGGTTRRMRPGDRTKGTVLLDEDTIAVHVGKKAAGRELDGRTWDEFPRMDAEVAR